MDIAAKCGLPKQLLQRVQLLEVLAAQPLKLKYNSFTEIHKDFLINDNLNNIPLESTSSSGKEILFLFELDI